MPTHGFGRRADSHSSFEAPAKRSGGLFSRLPLVLILGLLAALSYLGYTAASRSVSAFQESWERTEMENLKDLNKSPQRSDIGSESISSQLAQASAAGWKSIRAHLPSWSGSDTTAQ